eukprot:scaffold9060_cov43-Prasinocladus_malaysianus.AAC.1
MNNALDDAMAALLVEALGLGQTSVTTLLLKDNLLTWLTCDGLAPLLRQPLLPTSTLPTSVLKVRPAAPFLHTHQAFDSH